VQDTARLENALRNAHAAGDTAAARRLAQEIQRVRGSGAGDFQGVPYAMPEAPQQSAPRQPVDERQQRINNVRGDLTDFSRDPVGYAGSRMLGTVAHFMRQPVGDLNPARAFAEAAPAGQLAIQGATFGYGDEMMGGAAALGAAATGGNAGDAYRQTTDAARSEMSANREAAPVASMMAEGLGGIALTPYLPGGGFVANGTSRVGTAGRAALVGGGYGAVVGAGEAEGGLGNRAVGAAIGAPVGAFLGAATPTAIETVVRGGRGALRVLSRAVNSRNQGRELTGSQARTWNTLLDEAESAGWTEQRILERFDELRTSGLSSEEAMGELLGPNALERMRGGVATGNPDAIQGRDRINRRQAQQPARVRESLQENLGSDGSDFTTTRDSLARPTPRETALYGEFQNQPGVRRVTVESGADVYHGTPDSRNIRDEGFSTPLERQRGTADRSGPYFFTDNRRVAASYADDSRAFDYQNATPEVLDARVNLQRPLRVDAGGGDFRGIEARDVMLALPDDLRGTWTTYARQVGDDGRVRTDDLVKFARENGFDGLEVRNVRDTYTGDGPTSTVYAAFSNDQVSLVGPHSDRLGQFFQNRRFARIARQAAEDIAPDGAPIDVQNGEVTPELFDAIKKRIDRMVNDATSGATRDTTRARPLEQLQERFVAFADEVFPNYAPARAEAQVRLSQREALQMGRDIFNARNTRTPEDVAANVERMTPEQLNRFRQGVARGVSDRMNMSPTQAIEANGNVIEATSSDSTNPISRFFKRSDHIEALRSAFGDEANFERFVRRMMIERDRAANFPRISPRTAGSPTDANQAARAVSDGVGAVADVADIATGGWTSGLRRILNMVAGSKPNPEAEREIQRVIWSTVENERPALLAALRERGLISAASQNALMASRQGSAPAVNALLQSTQN
jgi:hypothetical protein